MYCRMCGKMLDDTDRHCKYCGAATGFQDSVENASKVISVSEEVVFNPPFEVEERKGSSYLTEEDTSEQEAEPEAQGDIADGKLEKQEDNLKGYISENEIEEQKKQAERTGETGAFKTPEFTWDVHEFPKSKKTEDVEFNWKMDEFGSAAQKEAAAAAFEEELFQEIREEANRIKESNIDRFFTFSKKNEEFQELLDKEYEKINRRSEPEKESKSDHTVIADSEAEKTIDEPAAEQTAEKAVEVMEAADEKSADEPEEAEEAAEVTEEAAEVTEEADKTAEAAEKPEIKIVKLEAETLTLAAEPEVPLTAAAASATPDMEGLKEATPDASPKVKPKAEHLQEMEQARAAFFGEELIHDNDTIKKKLEENGSEESHLREAESAGTNVPGQVSELEEIKAQSADTTVEPEETGVVNDLNTSNSPDTPAVAAPTENDAAGTIDAIQKKKNLIGTVILVIIGIILAIEIAVLGIRYFAPDSEAAKMINSTQTKLINTVEGWFRISGSDSGKDSSNETQKPDDQQKEDTTNTEQQAPDTDQSTPAPDPTPMADKAALVATQLGNNVNIQQVKANDTLAYQEGRNYGFADINKSKPITNNIWQTPEGAEPVYYDQSIVGTIIAFDSQWIDYVHGTNKDILSLLKEGSSAYKKTVDYPKIGKVQETFKLLEIGEIRQGSEGFYVWTHEEIQLTEQGKTSERKYNWIYYLEPVNGKMNIVNYFKF